jgi:predicted RNA-binding Zn-ribbon protein involved in translation (DUF1610 family)
VVFAVLVYWVLGFLVQDIESIRGPDYDEIENQYVDRALVEREMKLESEISSIDRAIAAKEEEMRIISGSSQNLQNTISQLIELEKLTVQKSSAVSEADQVNLSASLAHFLENQKQYQAHNAELFKLTDRKQILLSDKIEVSGKIQDQYEPAREKYRILSEKHSLFLAALQLLILIPLLAAGALLITKKRGSIYFPLFLGYGSAVLLKISMVIHEYFPARYFRYIFVLALLAAVIKLLVYFIKAAAFPKEQWLTKQYREAYERFLCPVCEYPVRTGPRKYLYWTRSTVNKIILPQTADEEKPYSCPACGTALFEECSACSRVRHSLLPNCQHCGAEKKYEGV